MEKEDKKSRNVNAVVTRRKALSKMATAAIGAGAVIVVGGVAYYLSSQAPPAVTTTTAAATTSQVVTTAPPAVTYPSPQEDPLVESAWAWGDNIRRQLLDIYEQEYQDKVILETIPGDYPTIEETKLLAGAKADIVLAWSRQGHRWYKAKWVRSIEHLADIDEIKKGLLPNLVDGCKAIDGTFFGLPQATSWYDIWRNDKLLKEAGMYDTHPKSFKELHDICLELKKSGLSNAPFCPSWYKEWYSIPQTFANDCLAHGEYLVDPKNPSEATFDIDTPIVETMEDWKSFWDDKLVPQGLQTLSEFDLMTLFTNGKSAFYEASAAYSFILNNPAMSQIAGYVSPNKYVLGEAYHMYLQLYMMSSQPRNPSKQERCDNLFSFKGWRSKKTGKFYSHEAWFDFASIYLGSKEFADSEVPKQLFLKDRGGWNYAPRGLEDYETYRNHLSQTRVSNHWKNIWATEFDTSLYDYFWAMLTGKTSINDTVLALRDLWDQLKKRYSQ